MTPPTKRFVALARVSSREQEREGFSLQVQEDALKAYAAKAGGTIVKLFSIAETASKKDERKSFKELLAFAKKNSRTLDAMLFYKLDRAARNLFDYVELEKLESEHGLAFISVSQQTEATPAGRMMRRTLANMASYYTEQQSIDVREGHARRVQEGWFSHGAPYGYRTRRVDGKSLVFPHDSHAATVRTIFRMYAYESHTLDSLIAALDAAGIVYQPRLRRFPRAVLHRILSSRAYIGEVFYRERWHPGRHEPLIDLPLFRRVQTLLGGHRYHAHENAFSGLVTCSCGRVVTCEVKHKKASGEVRRYSYFRCSGYNLAGHERARISEAQMDRQLLDLFDRLRIPDSDMRGWFREVLVAASTKSQSDGAARVQELRRQETAFVQQNDRLLNLRLAAEIDAETYAVKSAEIRDRIASVRLNLDAANRSSDETAELALRVFELSQNLREQWFTADYSAKRRMLELVFLNLRLDGVSLVAEMNKPFDVLAKGLYSDPNRNDWTPIELFLDGVREGGERLERLMAA